MPAGLSGSAWATALLANPDPAGAATAGLPRSRLLQGHLD